MRIFIVQFLLILIFANQAHAEVNTEDMNSSNNPLTPMAGVNLQDYVQSSVFGTDESLNSFLLRGVLPHKLFDMPQLARMTIPYQTSLDATGEKISAMGDLNIFDIFLAGSKELQFGIGPLLVLPTASKDETGAGKWQAGAAGVIIAPHTWGMIGALITYQHDFAGDEDRPTQNNGTVQPFFMYNMCKGYYLRSTGVMFFNLETGDYYLPIGFGAGKVWKLDSGTTMNLFAEPQWTAAHEGDFVPNYQTFVGLNFQFPMQ